MSALAELPHRRLTTAEVLRMVETGILGEDEPVELIEGELLLVSPQGPPHSARIMVVQDLLVEAYAGIARVRTQLPLDGAPDGLPEPDFAVVRGAPEAYATRHPTGADVLLAIEVAVTSAVLDRAKAATYARMGVADYWLVDVSARLVECRRDPTAQGYRELVTLREHDTLVLPGTTRTIDAQTLLG